MKECDEDMNAVGVVLFCKFCQNRIDHFRVLTVKMHVKPVKHESNRRKYCVDLVVLPPATVFCLFGLRLKEKWLERKHRLFFLASLIKPY